VSDTTLVKRLIYLVRHGETVGESSTRFHGRNDVALAESGRAQVARAAAALAAELAAPPPVLIHSPLARARASAEIIAAALRPPPALEAEPRLAEVWFGDLEGMTEAEIAAAHPEWHRAWKEGRHDRYPNGETLAGFAARIGEGFAAVRERHPRGDVVVVAHTGTIKGVLVHALALDWAELRRRPLALGSITVLEQRADAFRLLDFGRVP
jgi:probable phosphoglycerate mutase